MGSVAPFGHLSDTADSLAATATAAAAAVTAQQRAVTLQLQHATCQGAADSTACAQERQQQPPEGDAGSLEQQQLATEAGAFSDSGMDPAAA